MTHLNTFTLSELSTFYRTKGAKDKQERKKRGVGKYVASSAGVGLAGLGGATKIGLSANKIRKEAKSKIADANDLYDDADALVEPLQKKYAETAKWKQTYSRTGQIEKYREATKDLDTIDDILEKTKPQANKLYDKADDLAKAGTNLQKKGRKLFTKAGLVGAAGLAGAGYLGYKALKNRKHNKKVDAERKANKEKYNKSIKGRVEKLKNRFKK